MKSLFLRLVRIVALAYMLLLVGLFVIGFWRFPAYANRHLAELIPYSLSRVDFSLILTRLGWTIDGWIGINLVLGVLSAALFMSTAALILLRKSKEWFGLYLSVIFMTFGIFTNPGGALTDIPVLKPLNLLVYAAWPGFFLLFFLFPDGKFYPRWASWVAAGMLIFFGIMDVTTQGETPPVLLILASFSLVGVGVVSQVIRYRNHSNAVQRQQTKWVILAFAVLICFLLLVTVPILYPVMLLPDAALAPVWVIISTASSLIFAFFPVSVGFAILRYRLWDIDLIIRRTLVYGVLTATLALVYSGSVLLLQQGFRRMTGQESMIAVVISTLVIAALFSPLRSRLQVFIDQRFFRLKYDAARTVDDFSTATRDEVDVEVLSGRLVALTDEALKPVNISLWLRK